MSNAQTIRYAGLRYLDRTAALETGEVIPHGVRLVMKFTGTLEESLAEFIAGGADCAEIPIAALFTSGFLRDAVALPVFPNRSMAPGTSGELPILSVVVLRRSLYAANRWLAETLVDAFAEAKEEGMKRHRYFGALSVGLPWLMSSLEELDERFDGDAYRYGLGPNLAALERIVASVAPGATVQEAFAPETVQLPGVADTTFYAVPLSRF